MKLSDYILEQDISLASCDDIEVARCFAEMEVLGSIVECYAKQALIMEYYSGDPADFNIFMESDLPATPASTESSDPNVREKTKGKWYTSIFKWLVAAVKSVYNAITRVDYGKLIVMLKDLPEDTKFDGVDLSYSLVVAVSDATDKFKELLKDHVANPAEYTAIVDDLKSKEKAVQNKVKDGVSYTTMRDILVDLNNAKAVPKTKKLLAELTAEEDKFRHGINSDVDDSAIKTIRETAQYLSNLYSKVAKSTLNMSATVMRKAQRSAGKSKKQASKDDTKNS